MRKITRNHHLAQHVLLAMMASPAAILSLPAYAVVGQPAPAPGFSAITAVPSDATPASPTTSGTPATTTGSTATSPGAAIHRGNIRDFLIQLRTGAVMNNAELKKMANAAGVNVALTKRLLGNEYTIRLNPGITNADINTMIARLQTDSNILSAVALTPTSGLINGQLRTLRLSTDPGQLYSIYVPKKGGANAPIMIALGDFSSHLNGRTGDGTTMAEKYGAVVIIPQFTTNRFANYARLDPFDKDGAADVELNKIVAEAGKMAGANTTKLYLMGYGAGGEFAHRYAMAHPDLTAAVVTVNASSFTMPDATKDYPAGIKADSLPPRMTMDPTKFLKVPALAMATNLAAPAAKTGSVFNVMPSYPTGFPFNYIKPNQHSAASGLIVKRDSVAPKVNVLASRAQAWINAMSAAAKAQNLSTLYGYRLIGSCPGKDCIGHDGIVDAFTFLFEGKLPAAPTPTPAPASHGLSVNAGADQTVTGGSTVTLKGTTQTTGATSTILVYQWVQVGGPTVTLSGANTATATFTAPAATSSTQTLTFKLTVIDNLGYTRAAQTHVTISAAAPATGTTPPVQTGTVVQGGNSSTLPTGAK